ncbi:MAG: hypothetical protein ABSE52_02475 [Candidatus Dormibacteria bacterium]|jgi:hypothetical protein
MGPAPPLPHPDWGENSVTIPAAYFEEGRLPAVCVVTGAPATSNVRRRFSTTPSWVGWLFLLSWLGWLIAVLATRRSAAGDLPVCAAVAGRVRRLHAEALQFAALGVVAWIAVIPAGIGLAGRPLVIPASLVLFGIGLLSMVGVGAATSREAATLGIRGRVVEDGFGERWVQLRGVHPAFSRALAIRLGR